ncbi:MAG: YciI family protein [Lacibacter sp.]
MKQLTLTISFLSFMLFAFAQQKKEPAEEKIRQYWFVMLVKGNNRTQDSATAAKIQQGHMANITRLYNEGKIKVAGPFGDDGNWRGIFIFDCKTKEEVEQLLQTDPAISSGRLSYEIHPWWTAPTGSFKPGIPEKKE